MSAWLIIALVSMASMPIAFNMARTRGRSQVSTQLGGRTYYEAIP